MADPTDVVDRADTLMRHRRSFVARAPSRSAADSVMANEPPNEPQNESTDERTSERAGAAASSGAPTTGDDDDLPVLTDVVVAPAADLEQRAERFDETQVSLLASDIAHAIGQQLTSDLPKLIETALLNASEELHAGISATMDSALRDFIVRRKQLRLPLDEPLRDD